MSEHEDLWLQNLAVNSQDAADGKRACFARAVLALSNQVLGGSFAVTDDERDGVGLNTRRLLETKLLYDVLLDVLGDSQLFVIP